MAGLTGKTTGVGKDILDYLTAVANHFNITITVTSGFRNADEQALAMFNNWIKLKRGQVYSVRTLPADKRKELNDFYNVVADPKTTAEEKTKAKASFLKLAKDTVGTKSRHSSGRAVDVARATITDKVYKAITKRMAEIKEGNRTDIYHFESKATIPAVTQADKDAWGKP